jgi:phosphoribosylamine--glycine ligase
MAKYHITHARYETFTELEPALWTTSAARALHRGQGGRLGLGKGVVVAQTVSEAEEAARSMMANGKFGAARF